MKEAGIEVAEWPVRLRPLLSGKALTAYSRDVPEEVKKDYEHLKEAILDAMGLSVKECRADYFTYYKKPCESWQEAARNVEFYVNRMIYGSDTKQDLFLCLLYTKYCHYAHLIALHLSSCRSLDQLLKQ